MFSFFGGLRTSNFFILPLVTTLWLQGDCRAKWTYRFFKKSWPLFWRSHSFLRKSTYLFTDIFKDNLDIVEDNRKTKVNFPPRNHYFGVFHIDYYPMHYSITKKHTLSLHVKNIDIKNCAINSETAVVNKNRRLPEINTQFDSCFFSRGTASRSPRRAFPENRKC